MTKLLSSSSSFSDHHDEKPCRQRRRRRQRRCLSHGQEGMVVLGLMVFLVVMANIPMVQSQLGRCYVMTGDPEYGKTTNDTTQEEDLFSGLASFDRKCPNSNMRGIPTIRDLICIMEAEAIRVVNNPPQQRAQQNQKTEYVYTLCPNTTYSLDGDRFLAPALSGTILRCGNDGDSNDNCVLQGGMFQIRLQDNPPEVTHQILEWVRFEGITFRGSTLASIYAVASNTLTAEFINCHWEQHEQFVIFQEYTTTNRSNTVRRSRRRRQLLEEHPPLAPKTSEDNSAMQEYDKDEETYAGNGTSEPFVKEMTRHVEETTQNLLLSERSTPLSTIDHHSSTGRRLRQLDEGTVLTSPEEHPTGIRLSLVGGSIKFGPAEFGALIQNGTLVASGMDYQGESIVGPFFASNSDITFLNSKFSQFPNSVGLILVQNGQTVVNGCQFENNAVQFEILADSTDLTMSRNCFATGDNPYPIMLGGETGQISVLNYMESSTNTICPGIFVEDVDYVTSKNNGTSCVDSGLPCVGTCLEFTSTECHANNNPTPSPNEMPSDDGATETSNNNQEENEASGSSLHENLYSIHTVLLSFCLLAVTM